MLVKALRKGTGQDTGVFIVPAWAPPSRPCEEPLRHVVVRYIQPKIGRRGGLFGAAALQGRGDRGRCFAPLLLWWRSLDKVAGGRRKARAQ